MAPNPIDPTDNGTLPRAMRPNENGVITAPIDVAYDVGRQEPEKKALNEATSIRVLRKAFRRWKLSRKHGAGFIATRYTRRGSVELQSRQDDAVPDGVVFIPFAYVEAAANLLTNPALDPFGKIPEFKYCAAKVEAVPMREAAE